MNRTKQALSDAYWQLLEEKPYNKITVQNIVERCQVNRNTFYYHFSDIPALTEYTIEAWADTIIKEHCQFGDPIQCLEPIIAECIKRKNACLHLYRSFQRESLMRYLNRIILHSVTTYVEQATDGITIPTEDRETLIHFYKCSLYGVILDWLDSDMSYDLLEFTRRIVAFFPEIGKKAFLQHANIIPQNQAGRNVN
ncbi:MAG: TetR/AcrR family transcriptional regulator [Clostridiales bacterium]|nr:TetR/AcrR family transcriptional regulator [Clostridiales bacterium]